MSGSNVKDLRRQVRNVVQETLPELLQSEVFKGLYDQLEKELMSQIEGIRVQIKTTLETIDQRSKDVQSFILKQVQTSVIQTEAPKEGQ
jgi:hypothetical protein